MMSSDSDRRWEYLDARRPQLRREPSGTASLVMEGAQHEEVTVTRLFPFSNPRHFLAIHDAQGEEIGVVKDPEALDTQSSRVLFEEAEKTRLVPKIVKIRNITEIGGITEWDVETSQGPKRLEVRGGRENTRVAGRRVIVTDEDDNRFEVADMEQLDKRSRALLDQYL